MANMSRQKKTLFMTFMLISLLQMAQFALTPGIAMIKAKVFPELDLSVIQTAMTLPSLLSMVFSLVSALLISRHLISKKVSVIIGVSLVALTGLASLIFHTQFWNLLILSVLLGSGMGFYIAPSASIIFDNFNEEERRLSVGYQTSSINFGGIIMSVGGGFLATLVWYGGYLMLFIAIPVIIASILTVPNDHKKAEHSSGSVHRKSKIPLDVFYYGIFAFFFLLIFNVCGTNISTHIANANLGNTATAGIATAIQMAGGVFAGFIFNKLSEKVKDMMIAFAFFIVFIGFTVINLGQMSLLAVFIGVFITGMSISIIIPQCLFSTSNRVDASNSAAATSIVNCILPGIGGFLSPGVFTNLTTALAGESTKFRFQFVGFVALAFGILLVFTTIRRTKRETEADRTAMQASD
jgi:MFS family permease